MHDLLIFANLKCHLVTWQIFELQLLSLIGTLASNGNQEEKRNIGSDSSRVKGK